MTQLDQQKIIDGLEATWSSIAELMGDLLDDQWALPSPLPGWSVQDNVSHIIGTEAMLLGEPTPEVTIDRERLAHVQNDIGEFNEVWIEHLRSSSPGEVLDLFRRHTTARLEVLRAMPAEEWNAESFTPAGKSTYGRFMQIRVFDCWLHEQDVRDTVGRPGHERGVGVEVTLDELELAMGFVVGKRAGAPDGSSVRFDLTDGDEIARSIGVEVVERARLADGFIESPTVSLTMPVGVMTRRCAGRVDHDDVADRITIEGDTELGLRVAQALPYTI